MSSSTYSSSAPWSWTSESDLASDHDLTVVLAHNEVSLGLQKYLNKRELGSVAMTSRFALDVLTNGSLRQKKQQKGLICRGSEIRDRSDVREQKHVIKETSVVCSGA